MRRKVLYICSAPYSGSTLFSLLLGSQPAIASIGELSGVYRKILSPRKEGSLQCSCGSSFSECDFWQALRSLLDGKIRTPQSIDFSQYQYPNRLINALLTRGARVPQYYNLVRRLVHLYPPVRSLLRQMRYDNDLVIETVLQLADAEVFVDSSKSLRFLLNTYCDAAYEVFVVVLTRDGRGQLNSFLKHKASAVKIKAIARGWCRSVTLPETYCRQRDLKYRYLKYEDICREPVDNIADVCDWIGIAQDAIELDWLQTPKHILGNKMRLSRTTTIRLDERWKDDLDKQQIAEFMRIAEPVMKRMEYC